MSADVRMHRCPAPDCQEMVSPERLMCRPHWFMVPTPLRRDLGNAVADYRNFPLSGPDAEFKHSRRKMRLAQMACINALRGATS